VPGGRHAFSFWSQTYAGIVNESLELELAPHACEVLALRPALQVPQLVGTDLHLTQGGMELESERWDSERGELRLRLSVSGRKGGRLSVASPAAWRFTGVRGAAASNVGAEGLAVMLDVPAGTPSDVVLTFEEQPGTV
jgi:hypothetical protein